MCASRSIGDLFAHGSYVPREVFCLSKQGALCMPESGRHSLGCLAHFGNLSIKFDNAPLVSFVRKAREVPHCWTSRENPARKNRAGCWQSYGIGLNAYAEAGADRRVILRSRYRTSACPGMIITLPERLRQ